jgi:hypothetical protein
MQPSQKAMQNTAKSANLKAYKAAVRLYWLWFNVCDFTHYNKKGASCDAPF